MSGAIQKKERTCASTASQQVVEFGSEQIAVGDSGLAGLGRGCMLERLGTESCWEAVIRLLVLARIGDSKLASQCWLPASVPSNQHHCHSTQPKCLPSGLRGCIAWHGTLYEENSSKPLELSTSRPARRRTKSKRERLADVQPPAQPSPRASASTDSSALSAAAAQLDVHGSIRTDMPRPYTQRACMPARMFARWQMGLVGGCCCQMGWVRCCCH